MKLDLFSTRNSYEAWKTYLGALLCGVGIKLVATLLAQTRPIRISVVLVRRTLVYLIRTRRSHHKEQSVDGTPSKFLADEAKRIGRVLQEKRRRTGGLGHAIRRGLLSRGANERKRRQEE